jgi:hypothetical protein
LSIKSLGPGLNGDLEPLFWNLWMIVFERVPIMRRCFAILLLFGAYNALPASDTILWFEQPAQRWEEALPLGNGRMGAMVFGGELALKERGATVRTVLARLASGKTWNALVLPTARVIVLA